MLRLGLETSVSSSACSKSAGGSVYCWDARESAPATRWVLAAEALPRQFRKDCSNSLFVWLGGLCVHLSFKSPAKQSINDSSGEPLGQF